MENNRTWKWWTARTLLVSWRVIVLLCLVYLVMVVSDTLQPAGYFSRPLL